VIGQHDRRLAGAIARLASATPAEMPGTFVDASNASPAAGEPG